MTRSVLHGGEVKNSIGVAHSVALAVLVHKRRVLHAGAFRFRSVGRRYELLKVGVHGEIVQVLALREALETVDQILLHVAFFSPLCLKFFFDRFTSLGQLRGDNLVVYRVAESHKHYKRHGCYLQADLLPSKLKRGF